MTTVRGKLEARGYWRVEIRPVDYVERRVASLGDLRHLIERTRVRLRGWDFPHVASEWPLPESQGWIGMETDWSVHVEVWRCYLSGQFVYRGGVWVDWLDQHQFGQPDLHWKPRQGMPIVDSLWSVTEYCEFAARLAQSDAGAEHMHVSIGFHGMKGRKLFGDDVNRAWFREYGPARLDEFQFSRTLSRAELVATAPELARGAAAELFEAFGWTPDIGILEGIQADFLSRSGGA